MGLLDAALLSAGHGIAVVDGGSLDAVQACFQGLGVTEFRASVGQDSLKKREELKGTKSSLQTIKNGLYSALGTAVKQKSEKEAGIGEIEGKDAFEAVACRDHGIHFDEIGKTECLKVLVGPAKESFAFSDVGFLPGLPLLSETLKQTLVYYHLRMKVEKELVDAFGISTRDMDTLNQIIQRAFRCRDTDADFEQKRNYRVFFTSRKTLLNEFNHFEGNMNIFQPAIDINPMALRKEINDIESKLAEVKTFAGGS